MVYTNSPDYPSVLGEPPLTSKKELAATDKAEKATKRKAAAEEKKAHPPAAKRARKNPVAVAEIVA